MKTRLSGIRVMLAVMLMNGAVPTWGQEPAAPPADEKPATSVQQELSAGVQGKDVSVREAQFEEYGTVPEGVIVPEYKLRAVNEGMDLQLEANDVAHRVPIDPDHAVARYFPDVPATG